nr:odorant receptor 1 [Achelura yunnanensis]
MVTRFKSFVENLSTTVGEKNEIDEIMSVPIIIQRVFGHQVLDPEWRWRKFYKHKTFEVLLMAYVILGTLEIIKTTNDVKVIVEAGYTLTILFTCAIKLVIFINSRSVFRKVYYLAKSKLLNAIKADCRNTEDILNKCKKIVYAVLSVSVPSAAVYELTTFWNYINGKRSFLSRSTATLMPMTSPYFELAWVLHSIFFLEICVVVLVIDAWFVFFVYMYCAASDTLVNILRVPQKGDNKSGISYAKRLNLNLRKFYRTHIIQIEYFNELQIMYKWLALVPLFNAAVCMCIVLVVISKDMNYRFAFHVLPLLGEIFVYSYYGEQIKTKTRDIEKALLNFDWYNMSNNDKLNYFNILTYMQKKFAIKVANNKDLCMVTMTAVLKLTYQAYTVLQSFDS